MRNRFQGNFTPTLALGLYVLAVNVAMTWSANRALSPAADYVSRIALSLIMAAWVHADARKFKERHCYDFDSFVFFAWPVVVPVYLFRTRGMRAFLTLLCFAGIWLAAWIAAAVIILIRNLPDGPQ